MEKLDIESIKSKTDIYNIISPVITLKKRGSNYVGLCPFHDEKTPSFNVSPSKQSYKCFGCGKGGDVISFIQELNGITFIEAAKSLSNNKTSEDWSKSDAHKNRLATPSVKAGSFMPINVFKGSLSQYNANNFVQYLLQLFGADTTKQLIERYYIGTSNYQFWKKDFPNYRSPKGATTFWQIDKNGNVRGGKIMLYNQETGKRLKEPFNHVNWEHIVLKFKGLNDFKLQQCLFGEHLLSIEPMKPVAIVESEKTAIIASIYLPQYIWLACGSLSNLSAGRCEVLRGRKVVLYPDLKAFDEWDEKAKEFSKIAHFTVSDHLEREASEAEKLQKFDLADYLIRFDLAEFQNSKSLCVTEVTEVMHEKQSFFSDSKTEPAQTVTQVTQMTDEKQSFFETDYEKIEPTPTTPTIEQSVCKDVFFFPSVSESKSWGYDIEKLEKFFESVEIPLCPIKVNDFETITDMPKFIDSHFETIKANDGKRNFLPYLDRLKALRNFLIDLK